MKFYLDTANLDKISEAVKLGICDGITTNPSLMSKENLKGDDMIYNHYMEIAKLIKGDVSIEVLADTYDEIIKEAQDIMSIHSNVVVKIPCTKDGLEAIHTLSEKGIRCNCTLIFNLPQAIWAAKAGAAFISPFIGRIDDMGGSGYELLKNIVSSIKYYQFKTEIIAASIRNINHINQSILAGADIITAPLDVYLASIKHPLTDLGAKIFNEDAKKMK